MSLVKYMIVEGIENGERLDKWFKSHFPNLNHGYLHKLLRTGQIRIDGSRVKADYRLISGQKIRIPPINDGRITQNKKSYISKSVSNQELAAHLRDRIIYADDDILAINKPEGLAVQGGSSTTEHLDGVLNGLKLGKPERPRLAHRLDRDTSGVLLLARSKNSARWLTAAFKVRQTRKLYWALVSGAPKNPNGIIDLSLQKSRGRYGERMVITKDGKVAKTIYRVIDQTNNQVAWLSLEPQTGRTHQLRVHTAFGLSTPIIGDGKYGGVRAYPSGLPYTNTMQLHARAIKIINPQGKNLTIVAPTPRNMKANFKFLGFSESEENSIFI